MDRFPFRWVRQLTDWVVHCAATTHAKAALFVLAFCESSFFPIPPDVLQIAMSYGNNKKAYWFAAISKSGSVVGGVFGYAIGYFLWEAVSPIFLNHVFSEELFNTVAQKYQDQSFWIVFLAAFTPIPYKIFTITAGVTHVPLWGFVFASLVGRAGRFFLVGTLFYFWGKQAKDFIDRHFEWLTILFSILLILGFVFLTKLI